MKNSDLVDRLYRLDEDAALLFEESERLTLCIAGGSAFILLGQGNRATLDIDAIAVSRKLRVLLEKYDINTRISAYENNFPYNFQDRCVKLPIEGKKIDFYSVGLEDLIISKLYAMRPHDIEDITSETVIKNIDWSVLERLALDPTEARASALNKRLYGEFLSAYYKYIEDYRK